MSQIGEAAESLRFDFLNLVILNINKSIESVISKVKQCGIGGNKMIY